MPKARATTVYLEGFYLAFDLGRPVTCSHREPVAVKGAIDADALRDDLNRSFLPGGRNRDKALSLGFEPHISILLLRRQPRGVQPFAVSRAPAFEVVG